MFISLNLTVIIDQIFVWCARSNFQGLAMLHQERSTGTTSPAPLQSQKSDRTQLHALVLELPVPRPLQSWKSDRKLRQLHALDLDLIVWHDGDLVPDAAHQQRLLHA